MDPGHGEPPRTLAVLVLALTLAMLVLVLVVVVARELDRLDQLPQSEGGGLGHAHAAVSHP